MPQYFRSRAFSAGMFALWLFTWGAWAGSAETEAEYTANQSPVSPKCAAAIAKTVDILKQRYSDRYQTNPIYYPFSDYSQAAAESEFWDDYKYYHSSAWCYEDGHWTVSAEGNLVVEVMSNRRGRSQIFCFEPETIEFLELPKCWISPQPDD